MRGGRGLENGHNIEEGDEAELHQSSCKTATCRCKSAIATQTDNSDCAPSASVNRVDSIFAMAIRFSVTPWLISPHCTAHHPLIPRDTAISRESKC